MPHKIIAATIAFALFASSAFAQSGAVTGTPATLTPEGRPLLMRETSTTFAPPPRQHTFQVDDLVTVRVWERTTYSNTADNQRRRRIETETALTAWSKFAGFFKLPVAATGSLPEIGASHEHRSQNRGRINREEILEFEIQCRVTDVRPNGNLIIEGNRSFGIGEEGNVITLTGIISPLSIGADRRVDSHLVAELDIREVPSGNVFDTVRRPWGAQLIERFKPF